MFASHLYLSEPLASLPIVRANVVPLPFYLALSMLRYYMDAKLTGNLAIGGRNSFFCVFF